MKRYTDLEIADHAIMIENLPKNIPREYLEKRLMSMFKQICSGQHIEGRFNEGSERQNLLLAPNDNLVSTVSVISDYQKCNQLVSDLKLAAGKY